MKAANPHSTKRRARPLMAASLAALLSWPGSGGAQPPASPSAPPVASSPASPPPPPSPASAPATPPAAPSAPRPAACDAPPYRQFDFWLGEWEVTTPDGKVAGRNTITRIAGGCALHENWVGRGGFTGQSLNAWNKHTLRWQQTWLDSSGGRLDLSGQRVGEAMVLEGREPHPSKAGVTLLHRITWTPSPDGSVRQHWQSSEDEGRQWATAFDGRYVRKP